MAHIYHPKCHWSIWQRIHRWFHPDDGVSRFIYKPAKNDGFLYQRVQSFRCEGCGEMLHIDTDWRDEDGGFIGSVVEK